MQNLVAIGLLNVVLAAASIVIADDSQFRIAPEAADVRQHIERSLTLLEKGAVEWMQTKKCVTCHHIPMMLWTHYEARKHGFSLNDNAVRELEGQAVAQYLAHPEFTPTGQDSSFMEQKLGPGTVYLSLALEANPSPDERVVQALQQFKDNFVARQNENGSWTTKTNTPPLIDGHDSMTMLILTALENNNLNDKSRDGRERAIRWLKETAVREQSQPLVLRILVAGQSGDKDEVLRCVELLRKLQQDDGGWCQIAGLSTDALATGQALYALSAAGVPSDDSAVRRTLEFLLSTQQDDGSWLIHARSPNSHDPVISFYGTGWATLGLIQTLPLRVIAAQ